MALIHVSSDEHDPGAVINNVRLRPENRMDVDNNSRRNTGDPANPEDNHPSDVDGPLVILHRRVPKEGDLLLAARGRDSGKRSGTGSDDILVGEKDQQTGFEGDREAGVLTVEAMQQARTPAVTKTAVAFLVV